MKKKQLARRLAERSHITAAAAADQLDRILNDILLRIRSGRSASLPGLGTFRPDSKDGVRFDLLETPDSTPRPSKRAAR